MTQTKPLDEFYRPASACFEGRVSWSTQCVFLNFFDVKVIAKWMMHVQPPVYFFLKAGIGPFSSSSSLPEDTFSGPSLDVLTRNAKSAADFGDGKLLLHKKMDCFHFFIHGIALVWPSLVKSGSRLIIRRFIVFSLFFRILSCTFLSFLLKNWFL